MPTYNDDLSSYITKTFAGEDQALRLIRRGITESGLPQISIKPEEGRFLQFLATANGAKLALEIGTLGGYSGTWITRGLAENGRLITLEVNPHHAAVAREHFKIAGVADRVEVRQGNALDLLPDLGSAGPFDFIFIDAEKESYPKYLDWAMENLRPGGIIVAHNAFLHRDILKEGDKTERINAMQQFNHRLASDQRMLSTIFPAGDGLAIGVFRG
jgi:caffeoyl-CoA O-methyltransferase